MRVQGDSRTLPAHRIVGRRINGDTVSVKDDGPGRRGRLLAWFGLSAGLALLNISTIIFADVPADRMYAIRWSTTGLALLQFGLMLAGTLIIARGGGLRETLALRAPSLWKRAAGIGTVVFIGTFVMLVLVESLLPTGEAQNPASPWDPERAIPYTVNALIIAIVAPVVEELMFRGLGFTLLARFGQGPAILVTAALFGVGHGLFGLAFAATAFGLGLGYLRSRTSSVVPGIVLHILLNAFSVLAIAFWS